jgi:hypothetical protein
MIEINRISGDQAWENANEQIYGIFELDLKNLS